MVLFVAFIVLICWAGMGAQDVVVDASRYIPNAQILLRGATEADWNNRLVALVVDLARHCPEADSIFRAQNCKMYVGPYEVYGVDLAKEK